MLGLGWVDMSTELCYFAFVTNALMCIWNNLYVRTAEMKSNDEDDPRSCERDLCSCVRTFNKSNNFIMYYIVIFLFYTVIKQNN